MPKTVSDKGASNTSKAKTIGVIENPWRHLRSFTDARIGLGRSGVSLPTKELLAFQLAHAQARDAVHMPLHFDDLRAALAPVQARYSNLLQERVLHVQSQAQDRFHYLQRPDLGRLLDDSFRDLLQASSLGASASASAHTEQAYDLAIVIADGLSAKAVADNAVPFLESFLKCLNQEPDWRLAPVTLAEQGRVAIGDDVGELLNAKAVLMLIGERPGLSSPDSLGLYLTWAPKRGLSDAQRNCISNVRPAGLNFEEAAFRAAYLLREARTQGLSGVGLKDRSETAAGDLLEADTDDAGASKDGPRAGQFLLD